MRFHERFVVLYAIVLLYLLPLVMATQTEAAAAVGARPEAGGVYRGHRGRGRRAMGWHGLRGPRSSAAQPDARNCGRIDIVA